MKVSWDAGHGAAREIRAWFRAAHIGAVIIKEALSGLPTCGAERDSYNDVGAQPNQRLKLPAPVI